MHLHPKSQNRHLSWGGPHTLFQARKTTCRAVCMETPGNTGSEGKGRAGPAGNRPQRCWPARKGLRHHPKGRGPPHDWRPGRRESARQSAQKHLRYHRLLSIERQRPGAERRSRRSRRAGQSPAWPRLHAPSLGIASDPHGPLAPRSPPRSPCPGAAADTGEPQAVAPAALADGHGSLTDALSSGWAPSPGDPITSCCRVS